MAQEIIPKLRSSNKLLLSTCCKSSQDITELSFLNEGLDLFVAGVSNSNFLQQITFNPKVSAIIHSADGSTLYYKGLATIVKDSSKYSTQLDELKKRDKLRPQGIFDIKLVQIIPLKIEIPEKNLSFEYLENKPSLWKEILHSFLSEIRIWVKAVRLPFIIVSVLGVLVGTAVAFFETGTFFWSKFLLTELGIIAFHASADLFNDFFDHLSGNDEVNQNLTPFSGGSRMIQNNLFTPTRVFVGAIVCLLVTLAVGLYLNFATVGNIILSIGLAGAFLGVFYVGIPIKLVHYGLGELAIFLSFGPAIVFGSYYVQLEQFSWTPIYASILVGLLISLILFINQFPDYEADKVAGKKHWVVRLGRKKAAYMFSAFMILTHILLVLFIIFNLLPLLCLISLLVLPISLKAIVVTLKNFDNYLTLIPASAMTILTCISFSSLLSLALFVSYFL